MAKCVVTGANKGIGLQIVRLLTSRGDTVTALCRKASPELRQMAGVNIIEDIELTKISELSLLGSQVTENFDLLINNAGVLYNESLEDLNFETILEQLTVNALAPLAIVNALKHKINSGGKIAMITSRMGSISDNSSGGYYGYRMSKTALNSASKSLAIDLANQNISVGIYHPGFVKTDMTGHAGMIGPEESASNIVASIDKLGSDSSGKFLHAYGENLPW